MRPRKRLRRRQLGLRLLYVRRILENLVEDDVDISRRIALVEFRQHLLRRRLERLHDPELRGSLHQFELSFFHR